MITEIDKKIILELQKDGRASYADLASRIGISASTIARRIAKLIESKAIAIRALPNPYKMGLSANVLIALKCDPSKIDNVCNQMRENFYINNIHTIFGRFDILTMAYFPSWELLHHFINKKLFKIEGLEQTEVYHINEIRKRYQGLFGKNPDDVRPSKIRSIDQKLIESLVEDGRVSVTDLAHKLGVHGSKISRHISSLLQKEIIKICAVPNPDTLANLANATMTLRVKAERLESICCHLEKLPEIHLIMTMVKGNGLIVGAHTLSIKLLSQLIKEKILCIKGIKSSETFIRAIIVKRYYGWFLDEPGETSKL